MQQPTSLINKYVNLVMRHGKKTKAQKIVQKSLSRVQKETQKPGVFILQQAVDSIKPLFQLRKSRRNQKIMMVPVALPTPLQDNTGLRWIIQAARLKKQKNASSTGIDTFLASEILDAYQKQGELRRKRSDLHKLAEANKTLMNRFWWV